MKQLLRKAWKYIMFVWKDPVWSKVISAGIIVAIATIWAKFTHNTWEDIYRFIVTLLLFNIPVYVYLSAFGACFIISKIVEVFRKKKPDPFWDEQLGNYTFKELYNILLSTSLEVPTNGMKMTGRQAPRDNLLFLFQAYYPYLNKTVDFYDNVGDGGYLYSLLAPRFVGFGLVEVFDKPDENLPGVTNKAYQTSGLGHKFHSRLDIITLNETMQRHRKGENVIPGT